MISFQDSVSKGLVYSEDAFSNTEDTNKQVFQADTYFASMDAFKFKAFDSAAFMGEDTSSRAVGEGIHMVSKLVYKYLALSKFVVILDSFPRQNLLLILLQL